ncbi:Hypothetical predicted protein [Octopus vulgaris]|uniref:Protein SPEC3 n=1 Tax=Octopus vulgaris TaxID=6645 RepID=A0AA36BWT0_OCTVU|nr:Hypothetical predicted protein [Octopus vulgaris]
MQGAGYTRPMAPGYALNNHYYPPPSPMTIKKHYSKSKKSNQHDKSLRNFIPAMKKPVAITCLICNIFIPGLGTFISGLTIKCGSRVRIPDKSKSKVILTNTWVATLQFLTTFLLLLGWIWSVTWGVAFLTFSDDGTVGDSENTNQLNNSNHSSNNSNNCRNNRNIAVLHTEDNSVPLSTISAANNRTMTNNQYQAVSLQDDSSKDKHSANHGRVNHNQSMVYI